jgi:hypothetical protein
MAGHKYDVQPITPADIDKALAAAATPRRTR